LAVGAPECAALMPPTPALTPPELVAELNALAPTKQHRLSTAGESQFGDRLKLRSYRLGNGLEIRLLVDRSAPVVSMQTWFNVGSRDEKRGKTGLAHLLEHLMFGGTERLAKGEFDRRMEQAGAETNAATWTDWTHYYEDLPANQLSEILELESDRMNGLRLERPQVVSEKEVVSNERRWRVDDDVEGAATEHLYSLAFREHPYGWPTIGWMEDIQDFSLADVRSFYRRYYTPNNATLVLVGHFDEREALSLIQSKYGHLPSRRIRRQPRNVEPAQKRERRRSLRLDATSERLGVGYRSPAFNTYDWAVLAVISEVLFGGRSARLTRELVVERETVTGIWGSPTPFADPSLYEIWLSMRPGLKAEEAEKVIEAELRRLKTTHVPEIELTRAKNRLELDFLEELETTAGKAEQIGFYEMVAGGADRIFERLEDFRRVSPLDVMRVSKNTFKRSAKSTVHVRPKTQPEAGEE